MYELFFGLTSEPFSVAPDPRFMYLSEPHREALKHLELGLRGGGGFVLLTGEIGAGKTTVWRSFLERLPSNFDVATVVNPKLGVDALLARLCEDLGVALPEGPARDPIDALHGHLLLAHAQGRRTLVAVDEAQALSEDVLEQLRLLTNLVTSDRKLVQVLLIGQPELLDLLERPVMEPLAQRVVARFHLPALPEAETRRYIAHRLSVAGAVGPVPFDDAALARIHALCGGVPRRINVLCDRAMLAAWESRADRVDVALVERAATEVFARPVRARPAAAEVPSASSDTQDATAGTTPASASTEPPDRRPMAVAVGLALVAGLVLSPWVRTWLAGPTAAVSVPAAVTAVPAVTPAVPAGQTGVAALAGSPSVAPGPTSVRAASPASVIDDLYAPPAGEAAALRSLSKAWGPPLTAVDPCTQAAAQGLRCYRGRGGLATIRQLDRPAVLFLADARGRSSAVLLVGLSAQTARLRTVDAPATAVREVPLAALARDWRGDFATFWRAPPGWREDRNAFAGDPALAGALSERLRAAGGDGTGPLEGQVFAFQIAQGLAPDGLAGPQTLMLLNRATGVDEPRLAQR